MRELRSGELERLAFIKYHLQLGLGQAAAPEPLCASAILIFHDAVELLLQLAAEHLDIVVPRNAPFLDYWSLLAPPLLERELPQHGAMKRLNQARVALKHHGNHPRRGDILDYSQMVPAFFREAAQLVFGRAWDEISLTDFVRCEPAKLALAKAECALHEGRVEDGLYQCAEAWEDLVRDFEFGYMDESSSDSPFDFDDRLYQYTSLRLGFSSVDSDLGRFIDATGDAIADIRYVLRVLSLGIDYRRYARFSRWTPTVSYTLGGKRHVRPTPYTAGAKASDLKFCIEFLLDAAFRFQEVEAEPFAAAGS